MRRAAEVLATGGEVTYDPAPGGAALRDRMTLGRTAAAPPEGGPRHHRPVARRCPGASELGQGT